MATLELDVAEEAVTQPVRKGRRLGVLFWAAVGAIAMLRLGQRRRSEPRPFAATLAELERDRAWLEARMAPRRDREE